MKLRLGTRGSALALAQSRAVADALGKATGREVDLVEIVTAGDRSSAPVQRLGQGVFVSALRDALLDKEIDFAVHSYKDLPTAPTDGLTIAAVPPRADPRDALVARGGLTLAQLPPGSTVGTGAVRRIAQLNAFAGRHAGRSGEPATGGTGLRVVPIRGNVDTRLRKVAEGELNAVVLASAGLARLGRLGEASELLDPARMLPAPAQGALAVECRADDDELVGILSALDHAPTRTAVTAERALLAALEAGCSAPVAALAEPGATGKELYLRGAVISPDGQRIVRLSRTGDVSRSARAGRGGAGDFDALAGADELGRALAADLLAAGADTVLGEVPK